jgi:hypothetical protein
MILGAHTHGKNQYFYPYPVLAFYASFGMYWRLKIWNVQVPVLIVGEKNSPKFNICAASFSPSTHSTYDLFILKGQAINYRYPLMNFSLFVTYAFRWGQCCLL